VDLPMLELLAGAHPYGAEQQRWDICLNADHP